MCKLYFVFLCWLWMFHTELTLVWSYFTCTSDYGSGCRIWSSKGPGMSRNLANIVELCLWNEPHIGERDEVQIRTLEPENLEVKVGEGAPDLYLKFAIELLLAVHNLVLLNTYFLAWSIRKELPKNIRLSQTNCEQLPGHRTDIQLPHLSVLCETAPSGPAASSMFVLSQTPAKQ